MARAISLHTEGLQKQALACYADVLLHDPDNAEALHLAGVAKLQLGDLDAGIDAIRKSLQMDPDQEAAHFNLGNALKALGRYEDALASYQEAVRINPRNRNAHNNRACVLVCLKRYEEALAAYDAMLVHDPRDAVVLGNRGNVLHALKRYEEALECYDRSLRIKPDSPEVLCNRGAVLQPLKRNHQALRCYERVLRIDPRNVGALTNRGMLFRSLRRDAEATIDYQRALDIKPDNVETLINLGNLHHDNNRFEAALACFNRAQEISPHLSHGHMAEACCRLLMGDFERGLPKLEWRLHDGRQYRDCTAFPAEYRREFSQPAWRGEEPLAGKTILLHAEAGLGDMIHFARYATLAARRGARVLLEVPDALRRLMAGMEGISEAFSLGAPLPPFDFHCPLMSLPLAFGTRLDTIPAQVPYLAADKQCVHGWEARLGSGSAPRIGLVWSGNPRHQNDRQRSIPLREFSRVLHDGMQFVCLQKEVRASDRSVLRAREIADFSGTLGDMMDTAGLIACMDLVISVDTSLAHLAGAMGKPVWILLPFNGEWRWLLDRNDSPWYPSARLFRQRTPGDWRGVIAAVRGELAARFGVHGRRDSSVSA